MKSNVKTSWLIVLAYALGIWIWYSTIHGGFWSKYGHYVALGILLLVFLLYVLSAIIETIKYFHNKKKGE